MIHWRANTVEVKYRYVTNEGPLFIEFADKGYFVQHCLVSGYLPWVEFFSVRRMVLMPILSTRAVSRTPVPLKAMSTIMSFTPGLRAS